MKHKKSSFFWNDILRSSWFELGVLGLFVAIALLAPLIAPYDPNELDLSIRLQGCPIFWGRTPWGGTYSAG